MKIIKYFWGLIPITIFLLLKMFLLIIEKSLNLVLRDTPDCILFWFLIFSVLIFIIYVIIKIFSFPIIQKFKYSLIIKSIVISLYCVSVIPILGFGVLCSAFTYCSDDTMIENGMKMVVRDTSYLDLSLEYYEYKNVLFRGKQILKQVSNRTYWIYNSDGELIETGIYDD